MLRKIHLHSWAILFQLCLTHYDRQWESLPSQFAHTTNYLLPPIVLTSREQWLPAVQWQLSRYIIICTRIGINNTNHLLPTSPAYIITATSAHKPCTSSDHNIKSSKHSQSLHNMLINIISNHPSHQSEMMSALSILESKASTVDALPKPKRPLSSFNMFYRSGAAQKLPVEQLSITLLALFWNVLFLRRKVSFAADFGRFRPKISPLWKVE